VDDGTGCIQCAYYTNSVEESGVPHSDLQVRVGDRVMMLIALSSPLLGRAPEHEHQQNA
jgi:hypothetical protein